MEYKSAKLCDQWDIWKKEERERRSLDHKWCHNNAQTITNLSNHYFHIWVTVAKNYSKYAWLLFQHWPHKGTQTIQSQEGRMYILNSDCFLFFFLIQFLSWFLANQQLSVCMHAQSCLILCNPMDCSTQVFSVHGIFQARILEWIAISFSRKSSQPRDQTCISYMSVLAGKFFTSWTNSARILFCGNVSGRQGPGSYSFTNS